MFSRSVDVVVTDLATVEIDEDLLSVRELGCALGFGAPERLIEFLAAHTWLRLMLAGYLGCSPGEIRFDRGEHGKPVLADPASDLTFNLAYSHGAAVLAVSFRREVGVDVEGVAGANVTLETAVRSLSSAELRSYDHAIDPVRTFLGYWVRKEALAKARGLGVDRQMETTDVSGIAPVAIGGYEITDINLGDSLVAAVAAPEGSTIDLTLDDTMNAGAWERSRRRPAVVAG
jgi:4'-phosphopantetheinyl transferase